MFNARNALSSTHCWHLKPWGCFTLSASILALAGWVSGGAIATPASYHPISQLPPPAQPLQLVQGNQILLDGRTLAIHWAQWQVGNITRIGISDIGLMQALGTELLNTESQTVQPIQWFSDPGSTPLILPIRRSSTHRYLDVTDFASQTGLQLQPKGTQLRINAPTARVLAVRRASQPWGDRIVIELDRPTPWQIDQQSQAFNLTLNAQVDSGLTTAPSNSPTAPAQDRSASLTTLSLSQISSNQVQLTLGIPLSLRPRVWSLPNPNRIVVDVRSDSLVERNILWASGLRWRSQILSLGADRVPVIWLVANPRQAGVQLLPILPNSTTLVGTAPLLQTARQTQVAAAINGGFFNRNNQFPLGAIRQNGRWLSGPILNRGAIAWNASGEFKFDRLTLQETVITPSRQRFALTHLNSAYIQAGIARYTSDWGTTYTPFSDNEIVVTVVNNRITGQQAIAAAGSPNLPIPPDGYLLVLRSNRALSSAFLPGTVLRLETAIQPDFNRYPFIVGAGPLLIQNRQIVLDASAEKFSPAFASERASRSAIGQTEDGNIIIATVHNRLDGAGVSLLEMAQLMQLLGAIHALNLDGGSSTTLYLGGQILDRPPSTSARVHNGIGVFLQPER